ncbi:MAG TPA: transposase [Chloroflexota bacterium]|nr:transposase [Chloroflexota bacterium]
MALERNALAEADWNQITALLPDDWRERAQAHGLGRPLSPLESERAKLSDPALLLRLVLHHVANETSLAQTTAQAYAAGLVEVSPVALHKRMRTVGPWLAELSTCVTQSMLVFAPERWGGYRVHGTDGTVCTRPGAKGTTARAHYRVELASLLPQQVCVTDASEGEMLRRFSIQEGDLDVLDRAYCNAPDIAHARETKGDVIVRFNRGTLPLFDARGRALNIVPKVMRLRRRKRVHAWSVWIQAPDGTWIQGRICAMRLSEDGALRAQKWLRKDKGSKVSDEDLKWAEYIVVFTTAPAKRLNKEQVLELFRLRWQVELQIKRDKSIGGLNHLPNFREDTIAGWLCGKLLAQALARKMAAPFPPCGPRSSSRSTRGLVAAAAA